MCDNGDAFTNCDELFHQAFAAADPVPPLLQLLKQHPTYLSVRDMIMVYFEEIETDPSRGQALASALVRLGQCPDTPTYNPETLSEAIQIELIDAHFTILYDIEITAYGPTNNYLLESLISGLSLQHRLARSPNQLGPIRRGLNAIKDGSDESEVLVVGSCIQLLMGGFIPVYEETGTFKMTAEEILKKLRLQRGAMKHPQAAKVLELAISHAETGLKQENSLDDVWSILFPAKP